MALPSNAISEADPEAPPGHRRHLLQFAMAIAIVAPFVALATFIGIAQLNAGFVFVIYWATLKEGALPELPPALAGSLGGISLAWLLHALPAVVGPVGYVLPGGLALVSIYLMMSGHLKLLINPAFMLFLTIGSMPAISATNPHPGMMLAVILCGVYFGSLIAWAKRKTPPK